MAENTVIPYTFQHHNVYIDWLSYYLTPEEEKVLNKAIREIIGWRKSIASRRNHIALSVFVDGKKQGEKQVCMGCGLSKDAVRKALAALHAFNVLIKVGKPTQDGQEYALVEDPDSFKWDALKLRRATWDKVNQKRTAPAREKLDESRQEGVLSDSTGGVLSDSNKETQSLETKDTAPKKQAREPLEEPEYADEPFEDDNPHSKKRAKWETPETDEQKEFLAICGAKWFESRQKSKVKALFKAFKAGDLAGKDACRRCLDYIADKRELVEVPPLLPSSWYEYRKAQAKEHHWSRWGFIKALLDRDKLAQHCQLRQRELDRIPASANFKEHEKGASQSDIEWWEREHGGKGE